VLIFCISFNVLVVKADPATFKPEMSGRNERLVNERKLASRSIGILENMYLLHFLETRRNLKIVSVSGFA
jgi:hypothetical protein